MNFYQLEPEVTPAAVNMDPAPLGRLVDLFRQAVASEQHFCGAQLTVYRHGRRVLDIGGGLARASDRRPITPGSMFIIFSCTKGLAGLAMHMLHERGKFEYDDPIARYWPEFAQKGKANATIRHLLGHRIGIPLGPDWLTYEHWGDRQACARAMQELAPQWTPGEANGYHPLNYGFILNELLTRIDGRDCGQFLHEELFGPLRLASLFVGLPESEEYRVACYYESPEDEAAVSEMAAAAGFVPDAAYYAFRRAICFDEALDPAMLPFPEYANIFNRPAIHRIVLPAGGGIAAARDLAKVYAMLAQGGVWAGKQYIRPATIEKAITPTNETGVIDRSLRLPVVYGHGFFLGHLARGANLRTFGHPGKGGQVAVADLERGLSFVLLNTGQKNYLPYGELSIELLSLALDACR